MRRPAERALGEGVVSGHQSLGENPGASLAALKDSITQFAASVTAPAVAAAGPGLAALPSGTQNVAAAYGDFAKKHPEAARTAVGAGALGAGGAAGGWLSWKLWTPGIGGMIWALAEAVEARLRRGDRASSRRLATAYIASSAAWLGRRACRA